MDGNELAAQFIRDTRWNGLPDAVQHKVKMCLVDIIAAIVGGVLTPISDVAAAYAPVAWPETTRQSYCTTGVRGLLERPLPTRAQPMVWTAMTGAPIHEDIKVRRFFRPRWH